MENKSGLSNTTFLLVSVLFCLIITIIVPVISVFISPGLVLLVPITAYGAIMTLSSYWKEIITFLVIASITVLLYSIYPFKVSTGKINWTVIIAIFLFLIFVCVGLSLAARGLL